MKEHFKQADRQSAIIKQVDALCLTLPNIHRPREQSDLRASLKAAATPSVTQTEVLSSIKALRNKIKSAFADANQSLAEAEAEIADLRALKSYLDGEGDTLPATLPEDIRASAVAIKAAKRAGVSVAPSLSGQIGETIGIGETTLARLQGVVARREAASEVGLSKGLHNHCISLSQHPHATPQEKAIFKRAAGRYRTQEHRAMAKSKAAQAMFNRAVRMGA